MDTLLNANQGIPGNPATNQPSPDSMTIQANNLVISSSFGGKLCNACVWKAICHSHIKLHYLSILSKANEVMVCAEVTACSYFYANKGNPTQPIEESPCQSQSKIV